MYQLLRLCKVVSCRSFRLQVPFRRPVVGEFLVKEISALDSVKAIVKGIKKDRIYDFKVSRWISMPVRCLEAGRFRAGICRELDEVFALKCTYATSPTVTLVTVR